MIVKNAIAFKIHVSFTDSNFSIHSLLEMNFEKNSSTSSLNYTGPEGYRPEALLYSKDIFQFQYATEMHFHKGLWLMLQSLCAYRG